MKKRDFKKSAVILLEKKPHMDQKSEQGQSCCCLFFNLKKDLKKQTKNSPFFQTEDKKNANFHKIIMERCFSDHVRVKNNRCWLK